MYPRYSALGSGIAGMESKYPGTSQKTCSSQTNASLHYSNFSYSGLIPNERALKYRFFVMPSVRGDRTNPKHHSRYTGKTHHISDRKTVRSTTQFQNITNSQPRPLCCYTSLLLIKGYTPQHTPTLCSVISPKSHF